MTAKKKAPKTKAARKTDRPAGLWMVKQEPESYSWDDFVRDGGTDWTGVRNFQARNNLKRMKTRPIKPLRAAVPLASIRYNAKLENLPLIRQSQLSVMPLTKEEFDTIVAMGSGQKK